MEIGFKMKNVVFILSSPLSLRDSQRYGIDELLEAGVNVSVIDISSVMYPNLYSNNLSIKKNGLDIFYPEDYRQLYELFSKYSANSIFISIGVLPQKIIYRAKKLNCIIAVQLWGPLPQISFKHRYLKMFFNHPLVFIQKVLNKVVNNILYYDYDYDYYLSVSGTHDKKTVKCHCYDFYIELLSIQENCLDNKYRDTIVFIDQMIPYHPDYIKEKNPYIVNKEKYYDNLNRYFTYLEKKFATQVVIAAHPRSAKVNNYSKHFENRKVLINKSKALISESKFTITHNSTAVNFAIINKKPIVFVDMEELEHLGESPLIKLMAKETGSQAVYINSSSQFNIQIDEKTLSYDYYKDKYITQRSDNKTNGLIIIDEILQREKNHSEIHDSTHT